MALAPRRCSAAADRPKGLELATPSPDKTAPRPRRGKGPVATSEAPATAAESEAWRIGRAYSEHFSHPLAEPVSVPIPPRQPGVTTYGWTHGFAASGAFTLSGGGVC